MVLLIAVIALIAMVGLAVSLVAVFEAVPVLPAVSVMETVNVTVPSDSLETFFPLKENALLVHVAVPEMDAGAVMVTV